MKLFMMILFVSLMATAQSSPIVEELDRVETLSQGIVQIRMIRKVVVNGVQQGPQWYHRYLCDPDYLKSNLPQDIKDLCKAQFESPVLKKKLFKK